MAFNANPGYAFPLEKLGSDLARNQYNYESIFNTIVEWNRTVDPEVRFRLSIDTSPWFQDYVIPSKSSIEGSNEFSCIIEGMRMPSYGFGIEKATDTPAKGCELQHPAYGGERLIPKSVITSFYPGNSSIFLLNTTGFSIGDFIKFDKAEPTSTLDTGLAFNLKYQIVSINGAEVKITEADGLPIVWGPPGTGNIYASKVVTQSPPVDPENQGDVVTARVAIENNGGGIFEVWMAPEALNWQANGTYTYGNYVYYNNIIYRLNGNVYFANSAMNPSVDTLNYSIVYRTWVINTNYNAGQFVIGSDDSLYIAINSVTSSQVYPNQELANWKLYGIRWLRGVAYPSGSYVFDTIDNNLYVSFEDVPMGSVIPSLMPAKWKRVLFFKFPTTPTLGATFTASWRTWINLQELVIRSGIIGTSSGVRILFSATTRGMTPPSIYQRTTGIFPTSNFAFWPDSNNLAWQPSQNYQTNPLIPIQARQNYTASMVFDHTRSETVSTINWINYDGPDLDQGLAIYLPVLVETGHGTFSEPEDGFTYEFFFRIWPNESYTNAVTRDHIINKAQIYVYSAGTYEEITGATCNSVIAKFSMARLTNFYMFGENVSIPDKPVCYKATFAYNLRTKQWITVDYYQLPDHQFIGPIGYIDPQNPANKDINENLIGDIGPNPAFIGYETAGFPLFQDPFSNESLAPVRFTDAEALQRFVNRIL